MSTNQRRRSILKPRNSIYQPDENESNGNTNGNLVTAAPPPKSYFVNKPKRRVSFSCRHEVQEIPPREQAQLEMEEDLDPVDAANRSICSTNGADMEMTFCFVCDEEIDFHESNPMHVDQTAHLPILANGVDMCMTLNACKNSYPDQTLHTTSSSTYVAIAIDDDEQEQPINPTPHCSSVNLDGVDMSMTMNHLDPTNSKQTSYSPENHDKFDRMLLNTIATDPRCESTFLNQTNAMEADMSLSLTMHEIEEIEHEIDNQQTVYSKISDMDMEITSCHMESLKITAKMSISPKNVQPSGKIRFHRGANNLIREEISRLTYGIFASVATPKRNYRIRVKTINSEVQTSHSLLLGSIDSFNRRKSEAHRVNQNRATKNDVQHLTNDTGTELGLVSKKLPNKELQMVQKNGPTNDSQILRKYSSIDTSQIFTQNVPTNNSEIVGENAVTNWGHTVPQGPPTDNSEIVRENPLIIQDQTVCKNAPIIQDQLLNRNTATDFDELQFQSASKIVSANEAQIAYENIADIETIVVHGEETATIEMYCGHDDRGAIIGDQLVNEKVLNVEVQAVNKNVVTALVEHANDRKVSDTDDSQHLDRNGEPNCKIPHLNESMQNNHFQDIGEVKDREVRKVNEVVANEDTPITDGDEEIELIDEKELANDESSPNTESQNLNESGVASYNRVNSNVSRDLFEESNSNVSRDLFDESNNNVSRDLFDESNSMLISDNSDFPEMDSSERTPPSSPKAPSPPTFIVDHPILDIIRTYNSSKSGSRYLHLFEIRKQLRLFTEEQLAEFLSFASQSSDYKLPEKLITHIQMARHN